jgi:cholinesterase
MTYLLNASVAMNQPMVIVSIQYRLTGFGFLSSYQTVGAGATNLGLRDQRTALQWIQENIEAFGGDPTKVTIWGQSSGSMSVAHHLLAYGGRDDKLFRGAIMDSGFSTSQFYWPASGPQYQGAYDAIVNYTNCSNAADTLNCLRSVPEETMAYAINITNGVTKPVVYLPVIDNDFVKGWPSDQVAAKQYVKVPSIVLEADDEGGAFVIFGLNTTADLQGVLQTWYSITNDSFNTLIDLYPNPDNGTYGVPFGVPNATIPDSFGTEYRQASAIIGDLIMTAPRRWMSKYLGQTQPLWSLHWNISDFNVSSAIGANHESELPYIFDNPAQMYNVTGEPGWNADPRSAGIASLMSSMYISFVNSLDPNMHGLANVTNWPLYNSSTSGTNLFIDLDGPHLENDTFRIQATDFMNSIPHQLDH